MKNVLFLCLGNTCRSPMAAGILNKKAKEMGLQIVADSAGFESFHIGDPPDKRALETSKKFGIDISHHKARLFSAKDFDNFDRIFVMDHKSYKEASYFSRSEGDRNKIRFMMDLLEPGSKESVPDPFLAEPEACEVVYNIMDNACEVLIDHLNKEEIQKK